MRVSLRSALLSACGISLAAAVGLVLPTGTASAGSTVGVIVLREHGVGSSTTVQPYLDKLIDLAAQQNGWVGGKGKYETDRGPADAWIKAETPHYGIFSLAAFLALKSQYSLDAIGQAQVSTGGGQRYFVISKNQGNIADCKGKTLATDHAKDATDPRFIDKIIFDGKAKLADFTVDKTTRPVQTIKKVVDGADECALIDDAQRAQLAQMPEAASVKVIWTGDKLPPMVMVAFPSAPAAERKAFEASLDKICQGAGQQVCSQANVQSLTSSGVQAYAPLVAKY